jgi:hypothetical protein
LTAAREVPFSWNDQTLQGRRGVTKQKSVHSRVIFK